MGEELEQREGRDDGLCAILQPYPAPPRLADGGLKCKRTYLQLDCEDFVLGELALQRILFQPILHRPWHSQPFKRRKYTIYRVFN